VQRLEQIPTTISEQMNITTWTVLLAAGLTAVATGAGVLPLLFVKDIRRWWLSVFTAIAAGLMLGASHSLIQEGTVLSFGRTLGGVFLGLGLIVVANKLIARNNHFDVADLRGANARKALLILGVMTAHSFAEGVGVGVSFGGGEKLGLYITLAIAIHNIPEGLAISLVLVPRGTSLWKAAGWSIFTSLPQPLMAVPAFLFVLAFRPFLPIGLGLAAGAMIWMIFAELIPDANKHASGAAVGTSVTLAFATLLALQQFVLQP
jgi:zinc transporter, ZIP family